MTQEMAIQKVKNSLNGSREVEMIKYANSIYVFKCDATDSRIAPSTIIVALNEKTGKMAASIISIEDAIKKCS